MNNLYRIIDANINRASEGLRVLEDLSRFYYGREKVTKSIKLLRHRVRKTYVSDELLRARDSINDIGLGVSKDCKVDNKENIEDLINANFKRVQEALRTVEEVLKVLGNNQESKSFEEMRFLSYAIEKVYRKRDFFFHSDIYAITGEEFSNGRTTLEVVKELLNAEVKIIQYREKNKDKKTKYEECKEIMDMCQKANAIFIVNDDIDIAAAINAPGVHIGQEDMPIEEVKRLVPNAIIGVSTHNKEQALKAVKDGADYIGVGPMFKTTSKENVEKSEGLDYLKWVSENIPIDYVAIGGIKEHNIREIKKAGGRTFAMISEVVGVEDIYEKVKSIRRTLI